MRARAKSYRLLKNIIFGLVLVDTTAHGILTWVQEASSSRPDLTYLGLLPEENGMDDTLLPYFYDFIHAPFSARQINSKLARAWERVQLRAGAMGTENHN